MRRSDELTDQALAALSPALAEWISQIPHRRILAECIQSAISTYHVQRDAKVNPFGEASFETPKTDSSLEFGAIITWNYILYGVSRVMDATLTDSATQMQDGHGPVNSENALPLFLSLNHEAGGWAVVKHAGGLFGRPSLKTLIMHNVVEKFISSIETNKWKFAPVRSLPSKSEMERRKLYVSLSNGNIEYSACDMPTPKIITLAEFNRHHAICDLNDVVTQSLILTLIKKRGDIVSGKDELVLQLYFEANIDLLNSHQLAETLFMMTFGAKAELDRIALNAGAAATGLAPNAAA